MNLVQNNNTPITPILPGVPTPSSSSPSASKVSSLFSTYMMTPIKGAATSFKGAVTAHPYLTATIALVTIIAALAGIVYSAIKNMTPELVEALKAEADKDRAELLEVETNTTKANYKQAIARAVAKTRQQKVDAQKIADAQQYIMSPSIQGDYNEQIQTNIQKELEGKLELAKSNLKKLEATYDKAMKAPGGPTRQYKKSLVNNFGNARMALHFAQEQLKKVNSY